MTARGPADRASEALWRHVESNLHRQNASDAIPQLRQILACQVEATEPQGRFVRRRMGLFQIVSAYTASYNARTGEPLSMCFHALAQDSSARLGADACLAAATAVAQPPPEAVLE